MCINPHILHIVAGLDKQSGGPSESVPGLCKALAEAGCRVTLATLEGELADSVAICRKAGVDVRLFPSSALKSLAFSTAMIPGLSSLVHEADIVHTHGLWQFPMWAAGAWARRWHKPLVATPRGMLEPWSLQRSHWRKVLVGSVFDKPILWHAVCIHATANSELQSIRAYGLTNPVTVIPNGINFASLREGADPLRFYQRFPECQGKRICLFLSRIHPKKGLSHLIEAWGELASQYPDWRLAIAGTGDGGYLQQVREIAASYGVSNHVTFTGPLFSSEKASAFAAAELFVLPTYSENFGIAVAEALAAGVPVITTHGAPWEGLIEHHCGWWIPTGTAPLNNALSEALALPASQLTFMGTRGTEWVSSAFGWDAIARNMIATYQWLLGHGGRPDFVLTE